MTLRRLSCSPATAAPVQRSGFAAAVQRQCLWVPFAPWVFSQVSKVRASRLSAAVTRVRDANGRAELLVPWGQPGRRKGRETRCSHALRLPMCCLHVTLHGGHCVSQTRRGGSPDGCPGPRGVQRGRRSGAGPGRGAELVPPWAEGRGACHLPPQPSGCFAGPPAGGVCADPQQQQTFLSK